MEVFKKITTETKDPDKNNVVIMGKKTWLSIPEKFRPLPKRINIVLSRNMIETPSGAYLARSFKEAVAMVTGKGDFAEKVENVYIIGGSSVYKEAMDFQWPCRIYLTRVLADYDCDTYLPEFDLNKFKKLQHCEDVPAIRMTENGVEFEFEVYDKCVTKASEMSFNVMAAMCSNRGIGMANKLPWPSLSKEYRYYMNLTSKTSDPGKKCVNIKGRVTWQCTSMEEKARDSIINIVISRNPTAEISGDPYVHKVVASLDEALEYVSITLHDQVETVWVMGGQSIYTDAVNHPQCNKIYLTHIYGEYEADTFFPPFEGRFHEDKSVALDRTLQEERGVTYKYKVYCPRHQASC
ncbi:dihydrofolate reductase-like isoform X2 [Ylistrum balloti]|nr:dihydrofolate reductase-like isoform X2 [Ylistrum balloti]